MESSSPPDCVYPLIKVLSWVAMPFAPPKKLPTDAKFALSALPKVVVLVL